MPRIGPQDMTPTAQGPKILQAVRCQPAGTDVIDVSLAKQ
jgi:hypothetical protein